MALHETEMPVFPDDDMIYDPYIHCPCRFNYNTGEALVLLGWFRVPARVVVNEN